MEFSNIELIVFAIGITVLFIGIYVVKRIFMFVTSIILLTSSFYVKDIIDKMIG